MLNPKYFPAVFLLFMAILPDAAARSYLDVGAGRVSGDFDTGITSELDLIRVEYGYFGSQYFFNAAATYLNLETDGLDQQSGMGDVVLEAGAIYRPRESSLILFPSLSLKLPTADENDGLGSGEMDIGAFLDAHKNCGGIVCTAGLGYIFIGEPAGTDFNNVLRLSIGGFKAFQQAGLSAYLQYDSAMLDGATDPVKLGVDWFYLLNLKYAVYINSAAGLNSAAPDYGIRAGIVRWF
jgi:hypothetical protein